ncbi:hypothetical protein GCM10020331_086580 [Ectobacillus funiculus]
MADLAALINTFANAAFVFLPILIGFSATQRFGGNPYLGAALGMLMVHPDLLNGWSYGAALAKGEIPVWNIFGFEIQKGRVSRYCTAGSCSILYLSEDRNILKKNSSIRIG